MVNHLLETSHPFSSSALRLRASARQPIFHSPHALPSSVSRKPCICQLLRKHRGCGGILPILVHFSALLCDPSVSALSFPACPPVTASSTGTAMILRTRSRNAGTSSFVNPLVSMVSCK